MFPYKNQSQKRGEKIVPARKSILRREEKIIPVQNLILERKEKIFPEGRKKIVPLEQNSQPTCFKEESKTKIHQKQGNLYN